MLLGLGNFVFATNTLSFQKIQRQTQWRWANNNRVGQRPAKQFLGPGEDTITISGWVTPELCGDITSIELLREMGGDGNAYVLVDGAGGINGLWVIESVSETGTLHYPDGQARRIEFTVAIKRVDDNSLQEVAYIPPDWGFLA